MKGGFFLADLALRYLSDNGVCGLALIGKICFVGNGVTDGQENEEFWSARGWLFEGDIHGCRYM